MLVLRFKVVGTVSGILSKVFALFDIKYNLSRYFGITHELVRISFVLLKHNANVLHFLLNRVHPQGDAMLSIDFDCFLNEFACTDTILVRTAPVFFGLDLLQGAFQLLQYVRCPPGESWFVLESTNDGIIGKLDRIRLFKVFHKIQSVDPSFHTTRISLPLVVIFLRFTPYRFLHVP